MSNSKAGIRSEYTKKETAKIVLIPVEYAEINNPKISASQTIIQALNNNISLHDIETNSEVYKQGIYTNNTIQENNLISLNESLHNLLKKQLNLNKFTAVIGNSSLANIGTIRAFNEHFEDLTILHIGAATNVKKPLEDTNTTITSSMYEAVINHHLIQVGIRKMEAIEKSIIDPEKTFFACDMVNDDYWMENVVDLLTENILICFDLDGLDISIVPNAINALPGGLFWYETLDFLKKIFLEKNVVGITLNNLTTNNHYTSGTVAASLLYKMLTYKFELKKIDLDENDEIIIENKRNKVGKFVEKIE